MLRAGADPLVCRSNGMDSGSAPVRNIQIEPNLTKQKCQFVCYGQVQPLNLSLDLHAKESAPVRNIQIELDLTKQKYQFVCYGHVQILWRADPMSCFGSIKSMALDLHAKGSAPARNIQIELNLTKQKCQFVCYGLVQTLWRADPMACLEVKAYSHFHPFTCHISIIKAEIVKASSNNDFNLLFIVW